MNTESNSREKEDIDVTRREAVAKLAKATIGIGGTGALLTACATSASQSGAPRSIGASHPLNLTNAEEAARKALIERIVNARFTMVDDGNGNESIQIGDSVFTDSNSHESWLFYRAGTCLKDMRSNRKYALSRPENTHGGTTPSDDQANSIESIIHSCDADMRILDERVAGRPGDPDINEGDDVYHVLKRKFHDTAHRNQLTGFKLCLHVLADKGLITLAAGDDAVDESFRYVQTKIVAGEIWHRWADEHDTIAEFIAEIEAVPTASNHTDY